MKQKISKQTIKQLAKFGTVGLLNTSLDFLIFNFLTYFLGMYAVFANYISTSLVMAFSFKANSKAVFKSERSSWRSRTFVYFLLITAVGLYVIQALIIWLMTGSARELSESFLNAIGFSQPADGLVNNFAKLVATGASMIWNYLMYAKFIFGNTKPVGKG